MPAKGPCPWQAGLLKDSSLRSAMLTLLCTFPLPHSPQSMVLHRIRSTQDTFYTGYEVTLKFKKIICAVVLKISKCFPQLFE
jgi:hypothetical protein